MDWDHGLSSLELIMTRPAYFIMARIDVTGGSTGWHRAELIRSALSHLSEWWFCRTDYTRHWMPTGVTWSLEHTDITNYYLKMGVWGDYHSCYSLLPSLPGGFFRRGSITANGRTASEDRFFIWALGASLFSHAVTSLGFPTSINHSFLLLNPCGPSVRRDQWL